MHGVEPGMRIARIISGKLRRYHHLTVWQHLFWPRLMLLNIRDGFKVLVGIVQSLVKLIFWRPDVIFTKGGYVCMPVGIAAGILRIPLVIHDSDAHPGLTNRVLAKWACVIATGAPLEFYPYPKAISTYVGIPIDPSFVPLTARQKAQAKKDLGFEADRPLIVITGGGLGATRINDAVVREIYSLEKLGSVLLITGAGNYDEMHTILPPSKHLRVEAFITEGMAAIVGAADAVIARAGATTILELAAVGAPTILVPNAKLTGGHQVKNAEVYAHAHAVKILDEQTMLDDDKALTHAVRDLLESPEAVAQMTKNFRSFARPDATTVMAQMIIEAA